MKKYIDIWTIVLFVTAVAGVVLACIIPGMWYSISWVIAAGTAGILLHVAEIQKKEMVADYNERLHVLKEENDLYVGKYQRLLGQFDEQQKQLDQVKHEFHVYKREHPETSPQEEAVKVTVTASQKKKSKKKNNE